MNEISFISNGTVTINSKGPITVSGDPLVNEVGTSDYFYFTKEQVALAFTEWDRRFREAPEEFVNIAEHLLFGDPQTYGEECAPYFLSLLEELK